MQSFFKLPSKTPMTGQGAAGGSGKPAAPPASPLTAPRPMAGLNDPSGLSQAPASRR